MLTPQHCLRVVHPVEQVAWRGPGLEPGASGVRRPCARPLGNLTSVGHLAKASPDLSPHVHRFLALFSTTEKAVF